MFKRLVIIVLALLAAAQALFAVPAMPGKFRYVQPDGKVFMLQMHGDEYDNWMTDEGGHIVQFVDGYVIPTIHRRSPAQIAEAEARKQSFREWVASPKNTAGIMERHLPVILMEFEDVRFSQEDCKTAFYNLFNNAGYVANGYTGSVRDYFYDNSNYDFELVFDVVGPYKVRQNRAYYCQKNPIGKDAVDEVLGLAIYDLDPTAYDLDHDGKIDFALVVFAGHGRSEGGGDGTFWPTFINRTLGDFLTVATVPELSGATGTKPCGIGVACYQLGLLFGLPPLYDVNGNTFGLTHGMSYFSVMASGAYLNDGRTPPYLTMVEKVMLGWKQKWDYSTITGASVIGPIHYGIAYRTETSEEGEYFVYEYRTGTGWDKYLPRGLMVTHVDMSERRIYDFPASQYWRLGPNSEVNDFGDHPMYYVVSADDPKNYCYYYGGYDMEKLSKMLFPNSEDGDSFQPVDWNGIKGPMLTDIEFTGGGVQVKVATAVRGRITDADGPVWGARVALSGAAGVVVETCSDVNGYYELYPRGNYRKLDVKVSRRDYADWTGSVEIPGDITTLDVELQKVENLLHTMGYATIDTGPGEFKEGDDFLLHLISETDPVSVEWSVNGGVITAPVYILSAGRNTIEALVHWPDGSDERIIAIVDCG